jgi:hypothetical protein
VARWRASRLRSWVPGRSPARPGWIDEIDSSQQFGHNQLVEPDTYGEATQLGLKQCTGDEVLTIYGPVEIGNKRIRLVFLHKELRRCGRVEITGHRSSRRSSRAD